MQMINEEKYKAIFKEKLENPDSAITLLCVKHGTTYQSYNNWLKKQNGPLGTGGTASSRLPTISANHSLRVVVMVSINDIMKLIKTNTHDIRIPVSRLVRSLGPQERAALESAYGAYLLQEVHDRLPEPGEDSLIPE